MKKAALILFTLCTIASQSQEMKPVPMVSVNGEGKIKVTPDQALLTISVESKGSKATDVKKENDTKIDAVLKFIKKMNIAKEDYQTQRVSLYPNYDYEKKKNYYQATQTVVVLLKDLNTYDSLMDGLVDLGINRIDNVEFKSSKMEQLQSDARKLAIKNAKAKAEDFVAPLNQKVVIFQMILERETLHKKNRIQNNQASLLFWILFFLWGEQDSNLRSSHSRFTVCPRWPLEYLPNRLVIFKRMQI